MDLKGSVTVLLSLDEKGLQCTSVTCCGVSLLHLLPALGSISIRKAALCSLRARRQHCEEYLEILPALDHGR